MSFIKKLTQSGISFAHNLSDQRSIIVSNYVALVFFVVYILLVVMRFVFFQMLIDWTGPASLVIFLLPVGMNSFGFIRFSRIYLCWIPTLWVVIGFAAGVNITPETQGALYDGLRIYFLGFSCVPFLLISPRKKWELAIGLFLPALMIIFCDPVLNFFIGYSFDDLSNTYKINSMRATVAFLLISGSCFSLKWLVEKGEERNEQLINELAQKNKIIQQRAREEIQETTSRLALATDSAGIGIWEWDPKNDKIIWDKQTYNLFGQEYQPQKTIEWREFIHEEDYQGLIDKLNQSVTNRKQFNSEFRIKMQTGEIRYIYSHARVYFREEKLMRMIGVCWDVTDERIAEQQLQQSEANLHAIINSTNFYIWSVNRNYELQSINKPFKNYIKKKYNVSVVEGESIMKLYSQNIFVEEFSERWIEHYTRALAGESFEFTQVHSNRHFKYSLNPIIENAHVTGVSVFEEETTELRKKEMELREANKKIGDLRLMALRAAMNPHFIFNTLNSIQYFIMENDKLNAVNYLSTFSKLIRSILNNAVHSRIRLQDELDQLKYYVQLELLRFENKFSFKVNIDPELDVENIEIPSMLIQPYIENAILHGLYNKEEHGLLILSVKETGESVLFEIEDNGVGRAAAATFRLNLPKHKSLGMMLTEERLRLINEQSGVSYAIEDLEENGKPSGTRVRIWVKA